jgi:UDP-glucose 4-epimerase
MKKSILLNIIIGRIHSVLEVINKFESVFGMPIRHEIQPKKPFDLSHNNIARKNIGIGPKPSVNGLVKSFSQ